MLETDPALTPRPTNGKPLAWLIGLLVAFPTITFLAGGLAHRLGLGLVGGILFQQGAILLLPLCFAALDGGGVRSLGLAGAFRLRDLPLIFGLVLLHLVGSAVTTFSLGRAGLSVVDAAPAVELFSLLGALDPRSFLLIWAGTVLLSGLGEEMLFRGYLITRLERQGLSVHASVLLSALLFGLAHWPGYGFWLSLSKGFWFGVPAGFLFARRRSLWPTVVMHMIVNGVGFGALYLVQRMGI